ncbi:MAG: hypothetical protein FE037_05770 [Thermoplasmata archaeon]|nr:MAG: hypothetical protein FE037_05770 [Thermoplasmata archaeon]
MSSRVLEVRCKNCGEIVFKYLKIGKGRLWHCWKGRIIEDHSTREGNIVKCTCGNVIGKDEGKWIKLKPFSVWY